MRYGSGRAAAGRDPGRGRCRPAADPGALRNGGPLVHRAPGAHGAPHGHGAPGTGALHGHRGPGGDGDRAPHVPPCATRVGTDSVNATGGLRASVKA
jgi:hypothetical protein